MKRRNRGSNWTLFQASGPHSSNLDSIRCKELSKWMKILDQPGYFNTRKKVGMCVFLEEQLHAKDGKLWDSGSGKGWKCES